MDMTKYLGEQFIQVDDVRNRPLSVQIALIKDGKFDKPNLIFESGEILSLNVNNTKILIRAYGPDSDNWIGKHIELTLGTVKFQGKEQESVVVKPVSPELTADERAAAMTKMSAAAAKDMDDEIPF